MREQNPKQIVADGYDAIGESYAKWSGSSHNTERVRHLEMLADRLPPNAKVLDLGCGTGELVTKILAEKFDSTGVDISPKQIELARQSIPGASFICADMTSLDFPSGTFDAVAAFYSIIHVPREEQADLFKSIAEWLKPGGIFAASLGTHSMETDYEDDWLGAPMYWSGFGSDTNKRLVKDAGLKIISASIETDVEFDSPVSFLWIIAEKSLHN